ncbi:MAG TPA: translocation/assembly module TamB domain-containing protein [Terriglobales bacterium]|jgi:translocation and assembly module TamB
MAIRDFGIPPREPGRPQLVPRRKTPKWKKVLLWTSVAVLVLILIVAIGIYAALHNGPVHSYVQNVVQQKASAALNTPVQLQNFVLHPTAGTVDLYGVVVRGAAAPPNAKLEAAANPLLQVQHMHLGISVSDLLHGKFSPTDITVDSPVVYFYVNADGQTNLPSFQSNNSNSNTNLFDLAIRHMAISNGQVYVNDRKNTLDADLHDLLFNSNYDAANGGQYSGLVSYNDGHLKYDTYEPIPHELEAHFNATRNGLTLSNVKLTSGQSQVLVNATLNDYSNPKLHAKYVVILALNQIRGEMHDASIPGGVVLVNGTADYASVRGQAALESASMQGSLHSRVLQVRTPSLNTDIRNVDGSFALAHGNVDVHDLTASLLGGNLRANASVRNITGEQQGRVVAAVRGISLADLKRVANSSGLKPVVITGGLSASTVADWTGSVKNVVLRADATAAGKLSSTQANNAVPLNAEIHARYDGKTQQVTLNKSYVRLPQTSLEANGTVSTRSALQVNLESNDLHELETVADMFTAPAQPLGLQGQAAFNGTVRGSTSAPQIAGQLNAKNVQVRGTSFRLLRTGIQASPSQVSLQNGDLELGQQQGKVTFTVQSGLRDWTHTPGSPFAVNLNATQLSVGALTRAAQVSTPITGTLNANIVAHGTQLSPIGQGEINLRNANISGEPVKSAQVKFQGTGDQVHANLLVQVSAGNATGQLTYYPKQEAYDALIQATNIQLAKIEALRQRNLDIKGTLNLTASGKGTLSNPQGTASLTIPQLDVQKQQINDIRFNGNVANHEATFTLASQLISTPLRAQGKIALVGDYNSDISLDTPVIPLQPLLAAYAPAQAAQITGQTEIHATVRGPLKNKQLLEAHLNVPTLGVTYKTAATTTAQPATLQIAAVTPIRADYTNGVLALQPGEIKGTDTDIRYQGRLPLNSNAESTLSVQGGIDLAVAQFFDPTLASSGRMVFDINAQGYKSQPNVQGQIRIVNASFSTPDAPVGLSNGNGVLTLRRDRVDITQFTANIGGGTVTASGGVTCQPKIQYAIGLKGNDLRLLYPTSVRTDLGLNIAMTGNTDGALVQGQVGINQIYFTPDFDLASFMNQFGGVASPPPTQSFADNVRLNVAVRSTSELNAVSPTVSIQGSANLRVVGTANDPVIVGRANLSGGDVVFMGNRYLIQGGTIAFVNTSEIEPVVNLQASTTIKQYNINMRFRGPADRIHTTYTSDPALSSADIIHLLAFGNTEEAANAAPSQSSTLGAESLIASQVSSQVTSRVQKALGVSQISLDPQLGATTGNQQQGARLTVRQRVTSKLYVTFSTDVTTTQFSAVQLQYQLNRKWSVSGVRDENGGFSLDGRFHKDF